VQPRRLLPSALGHVKEYLEVAASRLAPLTGREAVELQSSDCVSRHHTTAVIEASQVELGGGVTAVGRVAQQTYGNLLVGDYAKLIRAPPIAGGKLRGRLIFCGCFVWGAEAGRDIGECWC